MVFVMKVNPYDETTLNHPRLPRTGTSEPYSAPQGVGASGSYLPEFLRLPRAATRDPHFGLSRSMWNQLILPCEANSYRPPIKSFSLRRKGTLKGVRIISAQSALDYFHKLEAEQNPPPSPEDATGTQTNFDADAVETEKPSNPHGFNQQEKTTSHQLVA